MKIYTTTGDKGTTSLVGGTRVPKNHPRLQSYGTVDELNSWIGLIMANLPEGHTQLPVLTEIQNRLFDLCTALATEPTSNWQPPTPVDNIATTVERQIDAMDTELPRHDRFIMPGGTINAANAHIARTVARRAERHIIELITNDTQDDTKAELHPLWLQYINRLSDYLFVLARYLNLQAGIPEAYWTPQTSPTKKAKP